MTKRFTLRRTLVAPPPPPAPVASSPLAGLDRRPSHGEGYTPCTVGGLLHQALSGDDELAQHMDQSRAVHHAEWDYITMFGNLLEGQAWRLHVPGRPLSRIYRKGPGNSMRLSDTEYGYAEDGPMRAMGIHAATTAVQRYTEVSRSTPVRVTLATLEAIMRDHRSGSSVRYMDYGAF